MVGALATLLHLLESLYGREASGKGHVESLGSAVAEIRSDPELSRYESINSLFC